MELDQFWAVVAESRKVLSSERRDGNYARQELELERLLRGLPLHDVQAFGDLLWRLIREADRRDLYTVAAELGEGCGDDGFVDFRKWLISMGRDVYERALSDPRSVVEAAERPEVEDIFFEEFGSSAHVIGTEAPSFR